MSSLARRRCRKASRSCRRASRRRRPPPPPTPPSRKWPGGQKLQVRMMLVQKQLQTKQRAASQSKILDVWNNDQSRKSQVFPRLPQTWESRTRRPWRSAASSWSWCQVGADLHVEVDLDAVADDVDAEIFAAFFCIRPGGGGRTMIPWQRLARRKRWEIWLRYESSTLILYKELSSSFFQSCQSVSQSVRHR